MTCQYSYHGHLLRIAPFREGDQQIALLASLYLVPTITVAAILP